MRSLPRTVNKEQAARRLIRALHCFPNFSSDVVLSLGKAKCTVFPQCNAASSGVDEGDSPEQAKLDAFCSAGSEENSRQWNRTTDMDGLGSGVIPPAFAAPRTSRILLAQANGVRFLVECTIPIIYRKTSTRQTDSAARHCYSCYSSHSLPNTRSDCIPSLSARRIGRRTFLPDRGVFFCAGLVPAHLFE